MSSRMELRPNDDWWKNLENMTFQDWVNLSPLKIRQQMKEANIKWGFRYRNE